VINDVTAAGYRYIRDSEDEFCIVTLSTGVGNKVFLRGRPLTGVAGTGGEIGHLQVDSSNEAARCDCGGKGHLGAIASGRGTAARARAKAEQAPDAFRSSLLAAEVGMAPATLTPEALASAYGRLDPWATDVVEPSVRALADVFAAIYLATGVARFVLIGGFAFGLGERFREAVDTAANARCWDGAGHAISVTLGQSDGACALIGGGRAEHLGLLDFVR
jgi:predicted NBD/HSP70 family sugar kinase